MRQQPKYKWPEREQCIAAVDKQAQDAGQNASSSEVPAELAEPPDQFDLFHEDLN